MGSGSLFMLLEGEILVIGMGLHHTTTAKYSNPFVCWSQWKHMFSRYQGGLNSEALRNTEGVGTRNVTVALQGEGRG